MLSLFYIVVPVILPCRFHVTHVEGESTRLFMHFKTS